MHLIKDHGMWRAGDLLCCCASSFSLLTVCSCRWSALTTACRCCKPEPCIKLTVTVHLTNVAIKRPWLATFNRGYPGYPPLPLAPLIAQISAQLTKPGPSPPPSPLLQPPAPAAQPS
jgi:hypothetical protein